MIIYSRNIRILSVTYNNIVYINANRFQSLKGLQELDLSSNYLSTLNDRVFGSLQTLIYLNLSFNNLEILEDQCFMGLDELRKLDLGFNRLKTLPPSIFQSLNKLEYLFLDVNEIAILDANLFMGLGKLKIIFLRDNMLSVLPMSIFMSLNELELLTLSSNQLKSIQTELFQVTKKLQYLNIGNNLIEVIDEELFQGLGDLEVLYLGYNMFTSLPNKLFQSLATLNILGIEANQIASLSKETFEGLAHLHVLTISQNVFETLGTKYLFQDLKNLSVLLLAHNYIKHLDRDIFNYTTNLRFIDLSSNKLIDMPNIQQLDYLFYLNIRGNTFVSLFDDAFSALSEDSKVFVSQHEVCECYVPKYVNCSAADKRSPYLTCDRLLSNTALVIVMWLIGLNAIGGNFFVFLWQKRQTRPNKVFTLLLCNLAASDFLMGIYMVIITSADIYFGDNFPLQSEAWRSGITCRIAGALSTISSEASVFFVMIISIDRFISIKFPFSTKKLGKRPIIVITVFTWIVAFLLGTVPSVLSGAKFEFYDNSQVCIGLPLTLTKSYTTDKISRRYWIRYGDA